MKKIFTIIFLSYSLISFSQKIDLDRQVIPVQYVMLPESNALNGLNTYTVLFYSEPATLARLGLKDDEIEKAFNLSGYTYTKEKESDILLEVTIDNMEVISESIESRSYDEKNAQGVMISKTGYSVVSNMIAPTYIKLINKTTNTELEYIGIASINAPITYKTSEFASQQLAQDYKNKSLAAKRNEFFLKTYKEKFNKTFAMLQEKYGYTQTKATEVFWKIDLKKAPEYTAFNEELEKVQAAFEKMTPNGNIGLVRAELEPTLKYWAENASSISPEDKKGRKLKYAYLINLARCQYWLEMLDECEATCNSIVENDFDKSDGKALLAMIKNLRKSFTINNVSSRHFERPGFTALEKFRVAGNIQKIEKAGNTFIVQTETAPKGYSVFPGYLIDFEKNRIDGELWVKNLDSDLSFMPESNTMFVYQTSEGQKKMSVSADNVDKLVLGRTAKFECIKFKNKINDSERMQLFRVLHENDKVKVLKYYKSPSNNNDKQSIRNDFKMIAGAELCLMRKSDEIIELVNNYIPQKVMENTANFYSDCAELKAKIQSGEIKNTHQLVGQVQAADYYAESCK